MEGKLRTQVFAGQLSLVDQSITGMEWESILKKLSEPTLHIRSLRLNCNDFSNIPERAVGDAVRTLTHLTDLSMCDARLASNAISDLFLALERVPAFAQPHVEMRSQIKAAGVTTQGARLCLMRNGINDLDLVCAGKAPVLAGVSDAALSGNLSITDDGFVQLVRLLPNVRRLHLRRTGITFGGTAVLDKHWPMLEALALNGSPIPREGFQRLNRAIKSRAKAVSAGQLKPPASSAISNTGGVERAHPYFHIDLRNIGTVTPLGLAELISDYTRFSEDVRKIASSAGSDATLSWVRQQYFSSGRPVSGLVLRHDFEGDCTVRLCIKTILKSAVEEPTNVYHLQVDDVSQRLGVEKLLNDTLHAVNPQIESSLERSAHQRPVDSAEPMTAEVRHIRENLKRMKFPFAASSGGNSKQWQEIALEHPSAGLLPVGAQRDALGNIAIGSLLRKDSSAERWFDSSPLGAPKFNEAQQLVELSLTLRLVHGSARQPSNAYHVDNRDAAVGGGHVRSSCAHSLADEAKIVAGRKRKIGHP